MKTNLSRRQMSIDRELLAVLKRWKQTTQFGKPTEWLFASPVQLGALPWSYPWVWRVVITSDCQSRYIVENMAERVGFEITCKRITNNLEGSGRQFY